MLLSPFAPSRKPPLRRTLHQIVVVGVTLLGCVDHAPEAATLSADSVPPARWVEGQVPAWSPRDLSAARTPPPGSIEVRPGADLEALVADEPAGAVFFLHAGVYEGPSISPKDGMTFIGAPGATFHGLDRVDFAFRPTGDQVTIRGLVVEHYASPLQMGAITAGGHEQKDQTTGWRIEECEVRNNAGGGIRLGDEMQVLRSHIHHNGQIGLVGIADGTLIEDNEIAYNNTRGVDSGWEAGGTKFVLSEGLVVRGNYVHHNDGKGIWTDIDNIDVLIERNIVEDNTQAGIMHEIGYDAIIRDNVVRRNGFQGPGWAWDAGITVVNSSNVEVVGNLVEDNADGITGIQQSRGSGAHGPWLLTGLWVHHNRIRQGPDTRPGGSPMAVGVSRDSDPDPFGAGAGNRFDHNIYVLLGDANARYFAWADGARTAAEWRDFGLDSNGSFEQR